MFKEGDVVRLDVPDDQYNSMGYLRSYGYLWLVMEVAKKECRIVIKSLATGRTDTWFMNDLRRSPAEIAGTGIWIHAVEEAPNESR